MELDSLMLSGNSLTKKDKTYSLVYTWNLKKEEKNLSSSNQYRERGVVVPHLEGRVREQIKWVKGAKGKNSQL